MNSLGNKLLVDELQRVPGTGQHQLPTGTWSYVNVLCNGSNLLLRNQKVG
jgi:hypothetical protein